MMSTSLTSFFDAPFRARSPREADDWSLVTAGQRVQIMKKDPEKIGALKRSALWLWGSTQMSGFLWNSMGFLKSRCTRKDL